MIDLNEVKESITTRFPDGQVHVNLKGFSLGAHLDIFMSIRTSEDLMILSLVVDSAKREGSKPRRLYIPYLMGARYDRVMKKGDSFDLKVIANMINALGFSNVYLLDVHSDVATAVIENSENIPSYDLLNILSKDEYVLIVPDSGAAKKAPKLMEVCHKIKDVVFCVKSRDVNGGISLKVLDKDKCKGKNVLIVDDLCDGGGTFNMIADQLGEDADVTLVVTHSIFSKGIGAMHSNISEIITTDSFNKTKADFIKCVSAKDLMLNNIR